MTMRLKKGWEPGDAGAVYEFDIKIPKLVGIEISDADFNAEARDSIEDLRDELYNRYSWISSIYQSGRSGGWLAIEDKSGGATKAKLKTINRLIGEAKERFIRHLQTNYYA